MTISRVQGNWHSSNVLGTSISVTLSTIGYGNTICGYLFLQDVATGISISDDKGNNYTIVNQIDQTTNVTYLISYYATNITNSPQTITATWTTSSHFNSIGAEEFSGVTLISALDGHSGFFNNPSSASTDGDTSGTWTTTANGDLIWGAAEDFNDSVNPTVGTGFTPGLTDTTNSITTEYRIQSTAGVGTASTFTLSGANRSAVVGFALTAALVAPSNILPAGQASF